MAKLFLRFDPQIEGGSIDDKFAKQIVVQWFSWGETNDSNGLAAKDFHFAADTDRQSPRLLQACAEGTLFNLAELNMVNEQIGAVLLHDQADRRGDLVVFGRRLCRRGSPRPERPDKLRFRMIDNTFRAQKPDGSLEAGIVGHVDFGKTEVRSPSRQPR